MHDGNRQVIGATNRAALALGLRPGMALSHAQAMVPGLEVAETDLEGDAVNVTVDSGGVSLLSNCWNSVTAAGTAARIR
jgi:hypothetical protein